MNRPLFRAVVAFALGEVTYVLTEGMQKAGMAITMSAFCVSIFIFHKRAQHGKAGLVFSVMYLLGAVNMICNHIAPSIEKCMDTDGSQGIEVLAHGVVKDIVNTSGSRCLYIETDRTECDGHVHSDRYNFIIYDDKALVSVGDSVSAYGRLSHIRRNTNPGAFDMQNYYEAMGASYSMRAQKIIREGSTKRHLLKKKLYQLRDVLCDKLDTIVDGEGGALYKGMLFGDKSDISYETRELYKWGGLSHILAISSLHVTMVGSVVLALLKGSGVPVYTANAFALCFIVLYAVMTGFHVSAMRAVVMMLIGFFGMVLGRDTDLLTALSAAYLTTLIAEPSTITDTASRLSFSAICGVAVSRYVIQTLLRDRKIKQYSKRHRRVWNIITALMFQGGLQMVMLPVMAALYYEIYPYSFFLNLIAVPLMTVVLMCGFAGVIVSLFPFAFGTQVLPIARLLLLPGCRILNFFKWMCGMVQKLPFNRISVGYISLYEVILYYLFLGAALLLISRKNARKIRERIYKRFKISYDKRRWRRLLFAALSVIFCVGGLCLYFIHNAMQGECVLFLDVGQGSGAIIRTEDGTSLLFDGGSVSEDTLGRYTLVPAIKYMGMPAVDYWFISHADTDHVSGLLDILRHYRLYGIGIKNIVMARGCGMNKNLEQIISLCEENKIQLLFLEAGDSLSTEDFQVTCVHPDRGFSSNDINEKSLALSYESHMTSVLFTGDMGMDALNCMVSHEEDFLKDHYDYMMNPHHGSKYSLCEEFYKRVDIGTAVISCGENNSYGHPHEEVLAFLESEGITILRTDEDGAIFVHR